MNLICKDESFRIIGASFEVYNFLGHGFLESVYQECLSIEFTKRCIPFESEVRLRMSYKDCELHQKYIADYVCFKGIILELKAHKELAREHQAQTINYLKATGFALGILINFGNPNKLEYQRFLNPDMDSQNSGDS